jgi:hypothetical protein
MGKIKKYQPGGSIKGNVPKGVKVDTSKVIKGMNKIMNPKKKDVDLSAPGKGMMEELKKKGSMPASQKNIGRKGIKVKKAKGGASLKPVPADRQKSLGKLPTAVRNKMGYQKNGGKMKKARGGATLSPSKKSTSNRLSSYGRVIGKNMSKMRMGGSMKKCRGGCY